MKRFYHGLSSNRYESSPCLSSSPCKSQMYGSLIVFALDKQLNKGNSNFLSRNSYFLTRNSDFSLKILRKRSQLFFLFLFFPY